MSGEDDFRDLAPLRALFELACSRIQESELSRHVMGDPGTGAYIAAYTQLLHGGWKQLGAAYDGGRLCDSFDIGENLLCFHNDGPRSTSGRWFSLLASCIELYAWNGFTGPRDVRSGTVFGYILSDAWSLREEGVAEEAWRLCPELFRGLQKSANLHLRAAALVADLVTSDDDARHEPLCAQLISLQASFEDPYVEAGGEWLPNSWYLEDPVFDPLVDQRRDRMRWRRILHARFPRQGSAAAKLRAQFCDPDG